MKTITTLTMNRPNRRRVLDCASPLAIFGRQRPNPKRQGAAGVQDAVSSKRGDWQFPTSVRVQRAPSVSDRMSRACSAFTLTEVVVICLVLGLCALVVYPALARTRPSGQAFQCMNNLRQLASAWRAYANDFNDSLVAAQSGISGRANWMSGVLNLSSNQGNWDPRVYIMISPLWPYAESDTGLFRCPADPATVSVNGVSLPRVRSYSMSQVFGTGEWLDKTFNPNQTVWRTYAKGGDIVAPARTFVFIEEHPGSINDGAFGNACTGAQPTNAPAQAQIIDFPASHHNGAGQISFADGSAQLHQWQGSRIKPPYVTYLQLNVPAEDSWMDIQWLAQNTTVRR